MRKGPHEGANTEWTNCLATENGRKTGSARSVDHAILMTLMDIRTELQAITSRLDCHETLRIPSTLTLIERRLRRISANTHKPKKRRKKIDA